MAWGIPLRNWRVTAFCDGSLSTVSSSILNVSRYSVVPNSKINQERLTWLSLSSEKGLFTGLWVSPILHEDCFFRLRPVLLMPLWHHEQELHLIIWEADHSHGGHLVFIPTTCGCICFHSQDPFLYIFALFPNQPASIVFHRTAAINVNVTKGPKM